jgi:hypothetical protein
MSAVTHFFSEFGHAFSHLVIWAYVVAIVTSLLQPVVKSRAWRNMLAAAYPHANVRWRDAYGAYLVKSGAGIFLPMHGDDAVRVTAALVGVSAWLGASVIDWHEVAAHPLKPAIIAVVTLVAIVAAVVVLRRRARGLGDDLKQGAAIFKHRGAYTRKVLTWHTLDFALELATLYLLLVAFGFVGATVVSVVLIRTAQRVTVSLPGFLETGSQQAMIVAILTTAGQTPGQAFGFSLGSKITLSGLNIVLALVAARVMTGPLHLRAHLAKTKSRMSRAAATH